MEEIVTGNIKDQNDTLAVLRRHFPECFDKNGDFDLQKFRQELSAKAVDFSKESYSLEWLGKSYARLLATNETETLLQEDKAFNAREENTASRNLLIKGDNLDVLKHLVNAYRDQVKMIYIDPPYNTGSDGFVYKDDRRFSVSELARLAGIDKERAKRILDFVQSGSNSHSAWLTFMYPRLYIARHLLREDGVIFVSIDDNEVAQLRILMDEIFGEENFIAEICVVNNIAGRSDRKNVATAHEYLLVYQKSDLFEMNGLPLSEDQLKEYKYKDSNGRLYRRQGLRKRGSGSKRQDRPNMFYPIYYDKDLNDLFLDQNENKTRIEILPKLSNGEDGRWRWGKETFLKKKDKLEVQYNSRKKEYDIYERVYLEDENGEKTTKMKSFLLDSAYTSDTATSEYHELMPSNTFNNPKPTQLIKDIVTVSCSVNDLILDFFAGSGTTGDAMMQLNAEDGGHRRYILVQLPEPIDPKKNKTAYDFVKNELGIEEPTIFDITRERLIRAARKIRAEHPESEFDGGFKIFETVPVPEGYRAAIEAPSEEARLFDPDSLTDEQVATLLLTWKTYDGVPLDIEPVAVDLGGYTAYLAGNKLYLMDAGFTTEHLKALLEKMDEDADFTPNAVIAFGYRFESKMLRELAENLKAYDYKKGGGDSIEFVTRY